MKTLVVRDYPAQRLPPELIAGIDPAGTVEVIVISDEPANGGAPPRTLRSLAGKGCGLFESPEEVDRYIHELRDEWD
jgi:hypothetical protein